MSLDLAPSIRSALINAAGIGDAIAQYAGEPAVFTRRPIPADAPQPLIIVNPDTFITDEDFVNGMRPIVGRNVAIYGNQPNDYRLIESLGYLIRQLFHRQKWSLTIPGYHVVEVTATGPIVGPVDDEHTVARIVSLRIRLREVV